MKIRNILIILCFGVSVLNALVVSAETNTSNDRDNTVIVTATRTAQTAEETLSSVTVITREDIEGQNATSIQEVLRSVAGVSVANSGGEGKLSSIFIRGTESDQLLVIVDGVKIGSATAGSSALQLIPVEMIDRIEIVRGPRSGLYGSEAIGGVIQIFTKKGEGELRPGVSLYAGSFQAYKAVASVSGGDASSWFNVSLSNYDTEGFNACRGEPLVGGCYASEPDDDSYRYTAGSVSFGRQLTKHTTLDLNFLRSDGNVKYDGFYNESDVAQQVAGAKLSHDMSSNWSLSLLLGQSRDESDDFSNGTILSSVDTQRDSMSLQSDLMLSRVSELTLGLDYQDDKVKSNTPYDKTTRNNKGLFAQYLHDFGKQNLQVSVRRDDNQQFDTHNTGSMAWGIDVNKRLRLIASYGTAFKAPTFNDLYYPAAGNPDLKPEESDSAEIELRGRESWGRWSVNMYRTEIDELIVYDFIASKPGNIEKASIKGIEFIVQSRILNWDTQVNVSLLDTENRSNNGNDGNELPRRAKKSAKLILARDYGRYKLGATVIADGKRFDDAANSLELNSYYTADINLGYQIDNAWKVSASLKNIFDEDYETVAYYNTPGRNYLVTVIYRPE